MNLELQIQDLITLIAHDRKFKRAVRREVRKSTNQFGEDIMTLKEQFDMLKGSVANLSTAEKKEFDEVKAKFEALHNAQATLQTAFDALKAELDDLKGQVAGVDLTDSIAAVDTAIANIDKISESDVPPPDTTPPTIPTNVSAANVATDTVTLGWDVATDDATSWNIFQDGSNAGSATSNSFVVSGLQPGTSYSFAVSAKDASGNESSQSDSVSVTTAVA